MSVYVDDMYRSPLGQFGRMKMSHMMADSHLELIEMASRIGVALKWIQHEGTDSEHFDISITKRNLAIEFGAIELTMREMGEFQRSRRKKVQYVPPRGPTNNSLLS